MKNTQPDLPRKQPFLLRKENRHLWYILIFPAYLIAFFLEEHLITQAVWITDLPIDRLIPFCKYFSIPYVLWYPLLVCVGLFLLVRDHDGFKRYMTYIGVSFFTVVIFYALVPNQQTLRDMCNLSGNDLFTKIIVWIHAADTDLNVCPSIHVIGSLAALFAVFESPAIGRRWPKAAVCVSAFVISISTLFIKQHGILDLLIAVPYSIAMYCIVYRLIFRRREKPAAGS